MNTDYYMSVKESGQRTEKDLVDTSEKTFMEAIPCGCTDVVTMISVFFSSFINQVTDRSMLCRA